jgi:hypothetical protein
MTRFLLLSNSCWFVDLSRSLRREDGSVVYNCCWPSPEQSFSGPSPLGLETIFHCLRFETSLFVASYDSQGYCGSIRPRLHTGECSNSDFLLYYLYSLLLYLPCRCIATEVIRFLPAYSLPSRCLALSQHVIVFIVDEPYQQ